MTYKMFYSRNALHDLEGIHIYIAENLYAPLAAENLVNKIKKEISAIAHSSNPYGYRKVYNYPGPREDIHRTIIKKYVIYFAVDRSNYTIEVLKIIHSSRNFIRYN